MKRHRWQQRLRTEAETHRVCVHCGLAKVTERRWAPAHIPGIRDQAGNIVTTSFWRDGVRLRDTGRVPACERVGVPA